MQERPDIRNVAIIAHVDHGKTTLVDAMLWQSGIFRANEHVAERVMDSIDLEREKGITIMAKNTSVHYKDVKINIVDTPGHADFGGEVERTLTLVDGVLLLVDAAEGPLPQTRFVLKKALEAGLTPVVVINKIDRQDARAAEVLDEVYDLFIDLDADGGPARVPGALHRRAQGHRQARARPTTPSTLAPLFDDPGRDHPAAALRSRPWGSSSGPPRSTGTTTSAGSSSGASSTAASASTTGSPWSTATASIENAKVTVLYGYEGLKRVEIPEAERGRHRGRRRHRERWRSARRSPTPRSRVALPVMHIDEPTVAMLFSSNVSPFAGREGKFVTSTQLRERLWKEQRSNVAHPGRGDRLARHLPGLRARRAPARDPDRDDAARGLRARGRQARDHHARTRTARRSSRWSTWSSTCPRSSSASSPRSSGPARAR